MKDEKKREVTKLKELLKTPKGRALVFFGCYFFFFLFIAIMARVGGTGGRLTGDDYKTGSSLQFNFSSVENNNYKYTFEVKIDNQVTSYIGEKNNKSELFTVGDIKYYGNNGVYFINTNGLWVNTKNPYLFSDFMKADTIKELIEKATYLSKTEYESGKKVYNLTISSATINMILVNEDLDVEEVPNEINLSVDEDGYVDSVKYTLDSWCVARGVCTTGMQISLKYDSYGKIDEITSPLE